MLCARDATLNTYRRNTLLDTVRGAALCGIVFINAAYYSAPTSVPGELSNVESLVSHAWSLLFAGKFFTLFSFLFGAGLQIFLARSQLRHERFFFRYLRRACGLYALGTLHSLVWPSDIIVGYVTISLLIMWLYLVSPNQLKLTLVGLFTASVCVTLLPADSGLFGFVAGTAYKVLPFVAGMYVARINGFEYLAAQGRRLAKYWVISGVVIVGFVAGYVGWIMSGVTASQANAYINLTGYPMAVCYFLVLACLHGSLFLNCLSTGWALLGRMSLTLYLTQDSLGRWLISLMDIAPLQPSSVPLVAVAVLGLQLGFCVLWLRYFRAGPCEWLISRVAHGGVKSGSGPVCASCGPGSGLA